MFMLQHRERQKWLDWHFHTTNVDIHRLQYSDCLAESKPFSDPTPSNAR